MRFTDHTILLTGDRSSTRRHESGRIGREAVAFFDRWLGRHRRAGGGTEAFHEPVDVAGLGHLSLSWTSEAAAVAMATFWSGDVPLTTSVLLAGGDPDGERAALRALQGMVVRLMGQAGATAAGAEPGYDLVSLTERPLIASVVMAVPPPLASDLRVVADMETCLAAAFFEQRPEITC